MAAEGIAKRATIGIGFHADQDAIDKFEHSLAAIGRDNTTLRDAFDRTDQTLDRFDEHISSFTHHYRSAMDDMREANRQSVESTHSVNSALRNSSDTYKNNSAQFTEADRKIIESERDKYEHLANNEHLINERLSETATNARHTEDAQARQISHLQSRLHSIGNASEHTGNRMETANGRVARSFRYSSNAISRHEQAIRDAQSHSYRWLRTAQDMSGATLGLGAAFYKGAKDATSLQQSYIHAGNMAHYGGEKIRQVQHDINNQWRVGSNLSVKYGISQDQIAKGYQALVARGYTTNESLHTQKSLLQAAIASGDNYNDVVKDSTNVLDAYNMRSQNAATMTNNTKRVVNEMAYAADQTATNFQGLGIGMSYVAATAHTTHQSISETSSALGILSNKGMQASQAGVGLRKVLNSFLSVNQKGQQAQVMKQLGLSESDFKTASGHLKSLGSLMSLLNNKTENMDSQERGAVFHRFFGATGQEAALNLASDTKGLSQLNDQVERSQTMGKNHQGYVALLSAHNMKSAQNQFNKFKQAWQAFTITAAREILPEFTDALKHLDVYIAKLNDLSPRAKKWTVFGALAIAAIAPITGVIFGIQSAFHGLEMTILHVRHLFSKPVSSNMSDSMLKQDAEDNAGADLTKDGSSAGTLSRVAKYDKGGLGYRALNLFKDHPTGAGIGSAATLAVGMGTFMGVSANREAANQIHERLKHQFNNPIQERIKAELDQESVNKSLSGNQHFEKQLQRQNQATTNNISSLLGQETKRHEQASEHNIQVLRRYAHISKGQANALSNENNNSYRSDYKNANNALKAISEDKDEHALNDDQKRIATNKHEINRLLMDSKHLSSSQLRANNRKISSLKQADNKFYHDETVSKENEWKRAYRAINNVIAGNGSKERSIYEKLSRDDNHISTKTAANLLRTSYRTTRSQIANANSDYRKSKNYAWKRYNSVKQASADEFGYRSKKYDQIVSKARSTRDSEINDAKTKRQAIVSEANNEHRRIMRLSEQQHRGLDKSVDLTTGHIITDWSECANTLHNTFHNIGKWSSEAFSGFTHMMSHIMGGSYERMGRNNVSSHAIGGSITHNELSLVNENGRESSYNPRTNKFRLFPNNGPQVIPLYQGEHVLTAQDTRELLTTGMGRGVTLPGYANGTDKLSNLKVMPSYAIGTGRAGAISSEEASEPRWLQNFDRGGFKNGIEFSASWLNIPHDLSTIKSNPLHSVANAATDAPGLGWLGHTTRYLRNMHMAEPLVKPFTLGAHAVRKFIPHLKDLHKVLHPISGLMDRIPFQHVATKMMHAVPADLSHMVPLAKKSIDFAKGKVKESIHNFATALFSHIHSTFHKMARAVAKAWRGLSHMGGQALRGGKRLLSHIGHGITRFSRHTWSGAKRLGRRLWTGTKHVAGRIWSSTKHTTRRMWSAAKQTAGKMWNSAKRTGRNIWSNTKRIARNVGHTAYSLWNRTKAGAARTWSHVVSGARHMASNIGHTTSRLFHEAVAKGRSAWSDIKSGAASAVSHAKALINGLKSAASEAASWIKSKLSHIHMPHFANGGPIQRSTMALVGEHGPETAYNPRSGSVRLLGLHGPQITELLAGERVLTNTQTQRLLHGGLGIGTKLPAYANGTGGSEVIDNSSYHGSRSFGIVGKFSGVMALSNMKRFSKKAKSLWDNIGNYITKSSKDTHSNNTDEWQDMYKDLDKINDDLSKDTRDSFSDMSKKVGKLADDMHDGLVSAAEDMASGFGDKFKKLIDYAKSDMESVIDKLNKGISGIDIALRAFGGNDHVIHEIHYATGSGFLTHNQIGILNDATSGPRQESILRNGQLLFPHGNDVRVPLKRGDAVLNGNQTKEISNITNVNHYAKGSGFHIGSHLIKDITKTLGLALKGPKKFFTKSFDQMTGRPSGRQLTKGIGTLADNIINPLGIKWTRAMFDFIKNLLTPDSNGGGSSSSVLLNEMHKLGDGHTYLWGAAGPTHYDCGGLVMAALHHLGMPSEHTVYPYPRIPASEATTGDIVQSATHVGVVADPHHRTYFSAYGPNLAKDSIKTQPLTNEYFTPGHPFYFRRPWKLYHEDQHRIAEKQPHKSGSGLNTLVKRELGPHAIKWLKAAASLIGDDGGVGAGAIDSTRIPGAPGSWTKRGTKAYNIAKDLFSSAKALGLDNKHAAALTGNAVHEGAGLNYGLYVHQFGGGPGKGVFQFNNAPSDMSPYGQDKAILKNGIYPGQDKQWEHSSGSVADLTHTFETDFERGSIPAFAEREEYADQAYHLFAANGGWADRNHMRIFGEAGPEVAINPSRDTADRLIVQAIGARMHHSPNSPIAGLVKSLDIRHRAKSLANDIKNLLTGSTNPKAKYNNNHSIKINVTNNITIQGNPSGNQAQQISRKVEQAIQRGIQRAALQTRNRLDW